MTRGLVIGIYVHLWFELGRVAINRVVIGWFMLTFSFPGNCMFLGFLMFPGLLIPHLLRSHMLNGLVIRGAVLPWVVSRGVLMAINVANLLFQQGWRCGATALPFASSSVRIHLSSPVVGPSSHVVHASTFHQYLNLCPSLFVHSTLSHETSVPSAMSRWAAGG